CCSFSTLGFVQSQPVMRLRTTSPSTPKLIHVVTEVIGSSARNMSVRGVGGPVEAGRRAGDAVDEHSPIGGLNGDPRGADTDADVARWSKHCGDGGDLGTVGAGAAGDGAA